MEITTEQTPEASIVSISGKVDAITAPEMETAMKAVLEAPSGHLILSLSGLDYISSAGLRVILFIAKQLKAEKRELIITGLSGNTKEVFEISGFYSLFKIFETREEAIRALA